MAPDDSYCYQLRPAPATKLIGPSTRTADHVRAVRDVRVATLPLSPGKADADDLTPSSAHAAGVTAVPGELLQAVIPTMHMHPDIVVCAIHQEELTAASVSAPGGSPQTRR